jgi:DNA-directed RNA polymerase specialized sigma24 family protein
MPDKDQQGSEALKRLMILLLYKLGSSSEEIGNALGVDSRSVRKMFSTKKVQRIVKPARNSGD